MGGKAKSAGRLVALLSELLGLLPCPAQEKPPKMLGGGGAGKSGAINRVQLRSVPRKCAACARYPAAFCGQRHVDVRGAFGVLRCPCAVLARGYGHNAALWGHAEVTEARPGRHHLTFEPFLAAKIHFAAAFRRCDFFDSFDHCFLLSAGGGMPLFALYVCSICARQVKQTFPSMSQRIMVRFVCLLGAKIVT